MAELKCGNYIFAWGKDQEAVQKECDKVTCTQEEQCGEEGKKVKCSKRSAVGASKEDPNLFLGIAVCICPETYDYFPDGATLDCGKSIRVSGKDKERVERDCAKIVCTQEKQCEDEYKRHCSKRSLVKVSKEDPKYYLGLVWCPCP
jgi:hypothetical protein